MGDDMNKEKVFVRHIENHLKDLNILGKVICKICNKDIDTIFFEEGLNETVKKILREDDYRCRLCEKIASKQFNSYFLKMTEKIHIRVCRHCYLRVTKYVSLWHKINGEK